MTVPKVRLPCATLKPPKSRTMPVATDAQELDRRQEDEGQRHRLDMGIAIGLVDLVEFLGGAVFVGESLNDADAAQVFRQVADHVGVAGARIAEGDFGAAGENHRRQHDHRYDGEGRQRQLGIKREHHDDDATQQQRIAEQSDQAPARATD